MKTLKNFQSLPKREKLLSAVLAVSLSLNAGFGVRGLVTENDLTASSADSSLSPTSVIGEIKVLITEWFKTGESEQLVQTTSEELPQNSDDTGAAATLQPVTASDIKTRLDDLKKQIEEDPEIAKTEIRDLIPTEATDTPQMVRLVKPSVAFTKEDILSDKGNRIFDDFEVTELLKPRVSFWFDIYTKYGFNQRVLHFDDYPWIVFEVADITPFIEGKGPYWLRVQRGEKSVFAKLRKYRSMLASLANRKSYSNLNSEEQRLFDLLKEVPGSRKQVFLKAAGGIRSQTGQREFYIKGLVDGSEYFPHMEKIFAAKKLPTELTRLPLTESSFNIFATSKVGASGIWQFMPSLGKRWMKVNDIIDERRSPLKSTEMAARLLKENHTILWKKWPLALTAYNHGPGGIRHASKVVGSRDLGQIVKSYRSKTFSFASSNFYTCFLAAMHAEKYKEHIFDGLEIKRPLEYKEIRLTTATRPSKLLKAHKLTKDEMYRLNPDIKVALNRDAALPPGLRLVVPSPAQVIGKASETKETL